MFCSTTPCGPRAFHAVNLYHGFASPAYATTGRDSALGSSTALGRNLEHLLEETVDARRDAVRLAEAVRAGQQFRRRQPAAGPPLAMAPVTTRAGLSGVRWVLGARGQRAPGRPVA